MLVNIPFASPLDPKYREFIALKSDEEFRIENPITGVYLTYTWLFRFYSENYVTNEFPELNELVNGFPRLDKEYLSSYGVADNVEQVLHYYGDALNDTEKLYCIRMSPVYKEGQPPRDGWRWHKWGPYIGTQNPRWEYLYDEPDIELVWCFHLLEVKSG